MSKLFLLVFRYQIWFSFIPYLVRLSVSLNLDTIFSNSPHWCWRLFVGSNWYWCWRAVLGTNRAQNDPSASLHWLFSFNFDYYALVVVVIAVVASKSSSLHYHHHSISSSSSLLLYRVVGSVTVVMWMLCVCVCDDCAVCGTMHSNLWPTFHSYICCCICPIHPFSSF